MQEGDDAAGERRAKINFQTRTTAEKNWFILSGWYLALNLNGDLLLESD